MIVDILLEDDVIMLAKVVETLENSFKVKYFVQTKKIYGDQKIYDYEDIVNEVDKECVSGYYDENEDESAAGFTHIKGVGFVRNEDDSEYEPDEESEDDEDEDEDEDEESEDEDEEL